MDTIIQTIRPSLYLQTYEQMQSFTAHRNESTCDEIWLCEHPPTYTLGLAGKPEHILHAPDDIPVVKTNRGGQVTYPGPGQVVAYVLLDLQRKNYLVKEYVHRLESAVIATLSHYGVEGLRVSGAPGVYVHTPTHTHPLNENLSQQQNPAFLGLSKISALGVKVSRQCAYHGLSLNVDMELTPFRLINPCGYEGLAVTDMRSMGAHLESDVWSQVALYLAHELKIALV